MTKYLIYIFLAALLSFSLSADDPERNAREVWGSVAFKEVRFQQVEMSEVVAYLNEAVKKELGHNDFPHVRLEVRQKRGLTIIRHDHKQKELNESDAMKIQNLLEGKLKKTLDKMSSGGQEDPKPVTLDLRNIQAFEVLMFVADISNFSLIYQEVNGEWLLTETEIHVGVLPVPDMLQEKVNEIIEDGLDVNLMNFFTDHQKWWQGYLGVLNRETLVLIAPQSDYAQLLKGLEDLSKRVDNIPGGG